MIKKYPVKTITFDIEALGGEVTLSELTIGYKIKCNEEPSFDNYINGLESVGLTKEQISLLSESVAVQIFNEVIDLTYPNARKELERLMESGEYEPPSDKEIKTAKKNS